MEIIEGSDGVFPLLLFLVSLTFVLFASLSRLFQYHASITI